MWKCCCAVANQTQSACSTYKGLRGQVAKALKTAIREASRVCVQDRPLLSEITDFFGSEFSSAKACLAHIPAGLPDGLLQSLGHLPPETLCCMQIVFD